MFLEFWLFKLLSGDLHAANTTMNYSKT